MMNGYQFTLSPRLLDELEELRAMRTDEEISYHQGCGFRAASLVQPAHSIDRPAKKRGRSGNKLRRFFYAVGESPQALEELCGQYDVSVNTVRQALRFDRYPDRGRVRTKTIAGVLMIWRQIRTAEQVARTR